jgi:hypothetical protein
LLPFGCFLDAGLALAYAATARKVVAVTCPIRNGDRMTN